MLQAEMETRLRSSILRLIRPALDEVSDLRGRLTLLKEQLALQEEILVEARKQKEVTTQHTELIASNTEVIQRLEDTFRRRDRAVLDQLSGLNAGQDSQNRRLDEHQQELQKHERSLSRAWQETSRLQDQHEEHSQTTLENLGQCHRKIERSREECMELVRELQTQREELLEELFGEAKGLTQITRDLVSLTKFTSGLPEMEKQLNSVTEQARVLTKYQGDIQDYCKTNAEDMKTYYSSIQDRMTKFKEDAKQDSNKLVAHHASLMRDIRREYTEELEQSKHLREEISRFQHNTESLCNKVSDNMDSESKRIDAIHREILIDIDEIQKRRKKDRISNETALSEVERRIGLERETSEDVRSSVEFLSRIIGLVLEGDRVANAMLVQDFADRHAEQWLAVPEELGKRAQPPQLAQNLDKKRLGLGKVQQELIPIDWRRGLVKSGYIPGQVPFQGVVYERKDMLLLHHKLLERAHSAFLEGPSAEETSSAVTMASISLQPTANGGIPASSEKGSFYRGAGEVSAYSRDYWPPREVPMEEDLEDPKLSSGPSARRTPQRPGSQGGRPQQRPGSQGQPQAKGSRGTMWGPLGETEPPTMPHPPSTSPPMGRPSLDTNSPGGGPRASATGGDGSVLGPPPGGAGQSSLRLPVIAKGGGNFGNSGPQSARKTKQPLTAR